MPNDKTPFDEETKKAIVEMMQSESKKETIFEVGKYYKHTIGTCISILCEAKTTIHGIALIAEDIRGYLLPVGKSKDHAVNWIEITKEEWMSHFDTRLGE